jgi:uncharacterized RDD family membrane protein YckC
LKLIDFGIARLFRPGASKDTQTLGTPGYAAPEQYGKGQSDARSDVYALGALLHYLLSLRDPSLDPMKFPPLRSLNPQVSPGVESVIHRALDLNPGQRWQSALELRNALRSASSAYAGGGIPAAPFQPQGAYAGGAAWQRPVAAPPQPVRYPPVVVAPVPTPTVVTPDPYSAGQIYASPYTPKLYADNSNRFLAYFVDGILLSVGSFLISMLFMMWGDEFLALIGTLVTLAWVFGYYTFFHARTGQTPGKKLAKIRVVRKDGSPLTVGRAFGRAVAFWGLMIVLSFMLLSWALFLVPLIEKEHRALHDLLADTWVVNA